MSVPVSQRSEAGNEFLYLTREIQVAAVQFCANQIPKKYHYLIANKIADAADQVHKHVKIANRFNPTKDSEYQIRRSHILTALGYLDALVTDIEIIPDLVGINPDKIERLSALISREQALLSMNELDHIIKDKLQVKYYGRYMDDGYIIFDNKYKLRVFLNIIREYCRQVGAELNEKKTQIVKISHGFTWLKARIYLTPSGKVIKKIYKRSIAKQRQKLKKFRKKYDDGIMTAADVYHSYQSWKSYAEHFMAWHSIQNMDKLFRQLFIREDLDAYVFQSY